MAVKVKSDDIRIYPASQRDRDTSKYGNNLLTEYNISSETKKLLSSESKGFVITPSLDRDAYDNLIKDVGGNLTQIFEFNIYGYNVEVKLQAIQDAINEKTLENNDYGEDFVYFTVDDDNVISANATIITSDDEDDSWTFLGGTEDKTSSLTNWNNVNIYIDGNLTALADIKQENIQLRILKCKQKDGAYEITDIYEDSHLDLIDMQKIHIKSSNGETTITDDELKHTNLITNGDYKGVPTFTIQSKVVNINGNGETDNTGDKGEVNIASDDEINLTSDNITITETDSKTNLITMANGITTIDNPVQIYEKAPIINIISSDVGEIEDEEGNKKKTGVVNISSPNEVNITSNDEVNITSDNEVNITSDNEIQETSKEIDIEGTDKINLKSGTLIEIESGDKANIESNNEIQETAYNTITLDVGDIQTDNDTGQEYFITEMQLCSLFDTESQTGQEYIKLKSNEINITGNDIVNISGATNIEGATTIDGTMKVPTATSAITSYTVSDEVGASNKPIYLQNGIFTASTSDVGSSTKPIYMSSGTMTASSSTVGSGTKPIYLSSGTLTASTSTVGSGTQPIYLSSGTITESTSTRGSGTQPIYLSSGTITESTSTVGDAYTPVYLNSGTLTALPNYLGGYTTLSVTVYYDSSAAFPSSWSSRSYTAEVYYMGINRYNTSYINNIMVIRLNSNLTTGDGWFYLRPNTSTITLNSTSYYIWHPKYGHMSCPPAGSMSGSSNLEGGGMWLQSSTSSLSPYSSSGITNPATTNSYYMFCATDCDGALAGSTIVIFNF